MKRISIFLFGSISYTIFFGAFLYWVGFMINFMVPKGIDTGESTSHTVAFVINTTLILLFGLQHSIMAREGFKKFITKAIPQAAERSVYVLVTSLLMLFIFWLWQPIPVTLWSFESEAVSLFLYGMFALGWVILLISTFLINHFELFGLQQIYTNLRKREMKNPKFQTPFLYKLVRHPMMIGLLIAIWVTPEMTLGHFLFSTLMSLYLIVGIQYEEKDLVKVFGEKYREYQRRVPAVIPFTRGKSNDSSKGLSLT